MTTSGKVLQILQLLKQGRLRLTAAQVVAHLGVSSATAYRYLAELEQVGLIERASVNRYVLGPTVVELDRVIRTNDPYLRAARDVMETLSERTGATVLLSRLHGLKVVCVHEVRGRSSPPTVSFERGRPLPLFRGATCKVILANLPLHLLSDISQQHSNELRQAGLPTSLDALVATLAKVREAKVYATEGEVDRGTLGWSVAIHQGRKLLGSMSAVLTSKPGQEALHRLEDQLFRAALRVEGRLIPPGQNAMRLRE